MNYFFERKAQKIVWIICVIILFFNWDSVNVNNSRMPCVTDGTGCYSLIETSIVILIMFTIISLLFSKKKGGKEEQKN